MAEPLADQTPMVNWTPTKVMFVILSHYVKRRYTRVFRLRYESLLMPSFVVGVGVLTQTTWIINHKSQAKYREGLPRSFWDIFAGSLMISEALWTTADIVARRYVSLAVFSVLCRLERKWMVWPYILLCFCNDLSSIYLIFVLRQPSAYAWGLKAPRKYGEQVLAYTLIASFGLVLDCLILGYPVEPDLVSLDADIWKNVYAVVVLDLGIVLLITTEFRLDALRVAVSSAFAYLISYLEMLAAVGMVLVIVVVTSIPLLSAARYVIKMYSTIREYIKL